MTAGFFSHHKVTQDIAFSQLLSNHQCISEVIFFIMSQTSKFYRLIYSIMSLFNNIILQIWAFHLIRIYTELTVSEICLFYSLQALWFLQATFLVLTPIIFCLVLKNWYSFFFYSVEVMKYAISSRIPQIYGYVMYSLFLLLFLSLKCIYSAILWYFR